MAPTGQMASHVLQRMQISGSIKCCLITGAVVMSMAVSKNVLLMQQGAVEPPVWSLPHALGSGAVA